MALERDDDGDAGDDDQLDDAAAAATDERRDAGCNTDDARDDAPIAVQSVRAIDDRGRHTTSARSLFRLPRSGARLDRTRRARTDDGYSGSACDDGWASSPDANVTLAVSDRLRSTTTATAEREKPFSPSANAITLSSSLQARF